MSLAHSPLRTRSGRTRENANIEVGVASDEDESDVELINIRAERERLELLRVELENLRDTIIRGQVDNQNNARASSNTRERNQLLSERLDDRNGVGHTTPNNNIMVSDLVGHLQYLHIDIRTPKFVHEGQCNPKEFLEDVDKYFRFRAVKDEHRLVVVENFLSGRARVWMDAERNNILSYELFKIKFLEEFYSVPQRIAVLDRWRSARYSPSSGTLHEFYQRQVKAARYFEPPLTDYEVNYYVVGQLPERVREVMVSVDYHDAKAVSQTLARLDNTYRVGEERRTHRRPENELRDRDVARVRHIREQGYYDEPQREWQQTGMGDRNSRNYRRRNSRRSERDRGGFAGDEPWRSVYDDGGRRGGGASRAVVPDTRYPPPGYQTNTDASRVQRSEWPGQTTAGNFNAAR